MADSPTYLPVYSLSEQLSPSRSDYIVSQSSAANGDVGLMSIDTFLNTFLQSYMDGSEIDATVTTLFANMGWTQGQLNVLSSLFYYLGDLIGSTALGTTATTITGAIAEHETDLSSIATSKAISAFELDPASNVTVTRMKSTRSNNTVCINGVFTTSSAIATGNSVFTIDSNKPGTTVDFMVFDTSTGVGYPMLINSSGGINTVVRTLPASTYRIAVSYQTAAS